MRIHIVAVAGTGMGALAGLLKSLGHDVSGSDVAFDPPMGPELESWGIRCLTGFDPAHLEPAPDLVVVGNVCKPNNPEARAAIDAGLPVTHIAGALARFVLAGNLAARRRRHARQDDHDRARRVAARSHGVRARLLDRRPAEGLRRAAFVRRPACESYRARRAPNAARRS